MRRSSLFARGGGVDVGPGDAEFDVGFLIVGGDRTLLLDSRSRTASMPVVG